jgi:hypothetical protein
MRRLSVPLTLVLGLSIARPLTAAAQFSHNPSFGNFLQKKNVNLKTRLPPLYNAGGKTIAISMAKGMGDLTTEVEIALEQQLTQNDSTIRVADTKPDLVITCQITRFGAPQQQRSTANGQTTTYLVGTLSVAFRISEPHINHVVKSDIATSEYDELIGGTTMLKIPGIGSAPNTPGRPQFKTEEELRRFMIAEVATKIASYLVNTQQTIEVALATNGGLDAPDKLALSGLWSRNLEDLETLSPFPDPKFDAYRIYNIGVANEALGYQALDTKAAIKYLQQASIDYGKALEQRPDEKYFLEPQNRIKAALAHYTEIAQPGSSKEHASKPPPPTESADGPLTNEEVIDMVKSLDEANVLDTIQTAPAVKFDLSVEGQIQLSRGGVNGKIIMAMKQRARAGATHGTTAVKR